MSVDDIVSQALRLDPGARARLAERLLESLETLSPEENAAIWTEEALRRGADLKAHPDRGQDASEAFRAARAKLR